VLLLAIIKQVGDKMNETKNFNVFIFLSTLARTIIDCYIPVILYNKGLEIRGILFFILLNYSITFLVNVPLGMIGKRITFKWAVIVSSLFIGVSYYFLLALELNILNLYIFTLTHAISTNIYWLSRHYYALEILPKKDLADDVGKIIIFSTLAIIPVSYVGALMMNNLEIKYILIIIISLYIVSIFPLFKIKEDKKYIEKKLSDIEFPRRSVFFMIMAQFRMISRYLFPLFIFIYIKGNYEFIGLFNIVMGIASTIFVYFFAKRMDKKKKDYLFLSGILGFLVYILKLNIVDTSIVLFVAFVEGLADKMYEVAFNRNLYALGHHYNGVSYSVVMEGLQNISRVVITLFFVFVLSDLKSVLYISSFMLLVTGAIGFDDGEGGY
jgi:hypothetical protein